MALPSRIYRHLNLRQHSSACIGKQRGIGSEAVAFTLQKGGFRLNIRKKVLSGRAGQA